MKIKITQFLIAFTLLFSLQSVGQKTITSDDLNLIIGKWTGSLTYIDYSSNEPYTMPANLIVKQGKNKNQLLLLNNYPKEPKANNKEKIKISKNGSRLNKIKVKSKEKISGEKVKIVTEYSGKDNNKKAIIKTIYIVGKNELIIRKEVKIKSSDDWILRNEYKYSKSNSL